MTAAALLPANAFDCPRIEKFVFSRPPDPARNTPGVFTNKSCVSRIDAWRSVSALNAVTETGVDCRLSDTRRAVTTMSSVAPALCDTSLAEEVCDMAAEDNAAI